MKLTPSQITAIKQQKHIFSKLHPSATYHIRIPRNTNIIRLMANYTMPSVYGDRLYMSASWSIGKHGKISDFYTSYLHKK